MLKIYFYVNTKFVKAESRELQYKKKSNSQQHNNHIWQEQNIKKDIFYMLENRISTYP
jgi:hypothetical protein